MVQNRIKTLAICATCIACLGCVPKTDIKAEAKVASPEITAKVAEKVETTIQPTVEVDTKRSVDSKVDSMTMDKGVNIGSMNLEGGALVALLSVVLVPVFLLVVVSLLCRTTNARCAVDLLVAKMETMVIGKKAKRAIQARAKSLGIEKFLNKRVKRVTKNAKLLDFYSNGQKV